MKVNFVVVLVDLFEYYNFDINFTVLNLFLEKGQIANSCRNPFLEIVGISVTFRNAAISRGGRQAEPLHLISALYK